MNPMNMALVALATMCLVPPALGQDGNEDQGRSTNTAPATTASYGSADDGSVAAAQAIRPNSKVIFRFDQDGRLIIEGSAKDVKDIEELLAQLEKDPAATVALPDVRKYRCKHIDVTLASQLLDDIYNGPQKARQRIQQQQVQAQRGRQQPQQQQQQQQRGGRQQEPEPEAPAEGDGGLLDIMSTLMGGKGTGAAGTAEDLMGIQVTADKRSGYLFIVAKTQLFPYVVETLHTIDTEAVKKSDYDMVVLKKLSADEVQIALEELLGIGEARQRKSAVQQAQQQANRARRPGQPQQNPAQLAEDLEDELLQIGESGSSFSLKDIRISSLPATNTMIVFGPKDARESIVSVIKKLDDQGDSERVVSVTLETANADSLAKNLQAVYAGATGESKTVKIVADAPTNTIYIWAPTSMREEIRLQIAMAEATASEFKPQSIQIQNGDAESIADTLQAMYKDQGTTKRKIMIEHNSASNKLVVSAPQDKYAEIEALARELDQSGSQSVAVTTFQLQHAYAPDVKDKIDKMAKDWFIGTQAQKGAKGGGRSSSVGPFAVSADPITNKLVVMGSPDIFVMLGDVLRQIDIEPPPGNQRATKTIVLTKADVAQTAANINKLYGVKDPRSGVEPPKAEANVATSAIILEGTEKQIEQIEAAVIRPLEEGRQVEERLTQVFALKNGDANSVAQAIQQTFAKRGGTGSERDQVTAVAESATQSVVVSASESNMEKVEDIIDELDSSSETTRKFHTVKVTHGDATEIARTLQQLIDQKKADRGAARPSVTANAGSNSLIMYVSETELASYQPLIDSMDEERAGGPDKPQRIVLQHANPSELADVLTKVFTEAETKQSAGRGGRGGEQHMIPLILADEQSKSIIVRAEAKDYEEIKKMVEEMDVEGVDQGPGGVRIINVARGVDVEDAAEMIERLIRDGEKARQDADRNHKPKNVSIEADLRTNSLIVAGSQGQFEEVERIVRTLEKMKPPVASSMKMIRFNNIKSADVKKVLDQMLEKQGQAGKSQGRR